MTDINMDELIAEARSLSTYEGSTLERAADALEQLWKQYGAVQAELAEAHTHFAIQEGRIEQFKRERDAALAEVEELRAQLAKVRQWAQSVALHPDPPADDEMAGQINAAGDVLAILSPTERETPADEPIAKRLTHTYMGDCPDDVNGWESRDPECPACRALEEMVPDDRRGGEQVSITDEQADAAQIAFHEFVFGLDVAPPTRRDLGIQRQAWKVAIEAALDVVPDDRA